MPRIQSAIVCDYAGIREGLLIVVAGPITRFWREQLPAPMGAFLALIIEVEAAERTLPHELEVRITAPSGTEIARAGGGIQHNPDPSVQQFWDPDESVLISLPLDLRGAPLSEYGWHTITISIDGGDPMVTRVKVANRPPPSGAPQVPGQRPRRPH